MRKRYQPIQQGDVVEIWWANPNGEDSNITPDMEVVSTPAGSGDLFYFKNSKGETIAINGNSLTCEGMRVTQRFEDRESVI